MKYVIFDLDGCLADDRRRKPLIDLAASDPFEAYHAECHLDPLINSYLIDRTAHFEPFVFTARPEKLRANTDWWLRNVAAMDVKQLFMRPEGSLKSSPELKKEYLTSLFASGIEAHDILLAFDDREDVLAVYESFGILAKKVSYPPEENSPVKMKSPAENLSTGAETFKKRNAVYGGSYLTFGNVMSALFPEGLKIDPKDVSAFNRLGVFVQIVSKCCRYSAKFSSGGHPDSAHDLMVYAAILESLTEEKSNAQV
jgi:hypothetical protein